MSKDKKKPDKPKKKPQKKAVKKPSSKKKPAQKPQKATDAIVFRDSMTESGMTVREFNELRRKNPTELTPTQKEQVDRANKQMAKMAKQIASAYDFSAISKMVEDATRPIINIPMPIITIPTAQLAAFQSSIIASQSVFNKQVAAITSINFVTSSMFADFHSARLRVLKAISLDIASFGRLQPFSDTEVQQTEIIDVTEEDGHIKVEGSVSKIQKIEEYQLIQSAKQDIILTELAATRAELNEVKKLLSDKSESPPRIEMADLRFQRDEAKLVIQDFEVPIHKTSKQAIFCEVFFINGLATIWDIEDFIAEAFQESITPNYPEAYWLNRLRNYIFQLNKSIQLATKGLFEDFFILKDYKVYINKKYISHL